MKLSSIHESATTKSVEDWKAEVKAKYASVASKIKFKSQDQGKTISAEVPGEDRCYGVYDLEKEQGEVLGEAAK